MFAEGSRRPDIFTDAIRSLVALAEEVADRSVRPESCLGLVHFHQGGPLRRIQEAYADC